MANLSATLLLMSLLVGAAVAQDCKAPVPFSSKLIGKTYFKTDDCYRPSSQSHVNVYAKLFVYKPTFVTRFFTFQCDERYVFHYRRNGKDPFVVHFPTLPHPDGYDVGSQENLEAFCDKEHVKVRKKYLPVGPTRQKFIKAIRTVVAGATEIRDFGCFEDENGFIRQVEGRAFTNVDVDGVISYLFGLGYQYNFCAESTSR